MIQTAQNMMIDLKMLETPLVDGKEKTIVDVESAIDSEDFANELKATLSADAGNIGKVMPIELPDDQLIQEPSKLLNRVPSSGNTEIMGPKIFDPDVTRGVEKIIAPTTTDAMPVKISDEQVLKLAKGEVNEVKAEIAQNMLKSQSLSRPSIDRAPAIDFAHAEIDPQLMNMEDFLLQKNITSKKAPATSNAYGINLKPQIQKEALSLDLNPSQIIGESAGVEVGNEAVNSQQFILNMMSEQSPKITETQVPVRVFEMGQLKTDNANQIINQITDYIVQVKASKEPTVNLRVNHDDLGMIDITVSKNAPTPGVQDSVAINIGTHTQDGKSFFQQNSKDLFSHLTQSGLNVADLKIETPTQTAKNDFDMGGQSRQGQSGAEKQFGSEQNQRRHESDRRQELWDLLKNSEAA